MPVSPLVLFGSIGTVLSTIAIIPHLLHAVKARRPGGSALAWTLGAVCSSVWFAYGIAAHDLLVSAPGLVTVPVGATLSTWAIMARRRAPIASVIPLRAVPEPTTTPAAAPSTVEETVVTLPQPWAARGACSGDTLELPRITVG